MPDDDDIRGDDDAPPQKEDVEIEAADGSSRGMFNVFNEDPRFVYPLPSDKEIRDVPIDRGDTLIRKYGPGENDIDRRPIVGVAVFGTILGIALKILAPRRITAPDRNSPIIRDTARDSEGKQTLVELRPGTVFYGGRESGFYDSDGIILEAHHIGGDPGRYEDWIYYVVGKSDFDKYAPQWITLDDVGGAIASPTSILEFPLDISKSVEELLTVGESELFAYFVNKPHALTDLSPESFEQLVGEIYKNLGFSVEHLGAWNQEDGGVDIVAVSKSTAGTELRLAIQCKTSKNAVSAKPIRELAGVLDAFRAHQGVVATTSRFTSSAETEASGIPSVAPLSPVMQNALC